MAPGFVASASFAARDPSPPDVLDVDGGVVDGRRRVRPGRPGHAVHAFARALAQLGPTDADRRAHLLARRVSRPSNAWRSRSAPASPELRGRPARSRGRPCGRAARRRRRPRRRPSPRSRAARSFVAGRPRRPRRTRGRRRTGPPCSHRRRTQRNPSWTRRPRSGTRRGSTAANPTSAARGDAVTVETGCVQTPRTVAPFTRSTIASDCSSSRGGASRAALEHEVPELAPGSPPGSGRARPRSATSQLAHTEVPRPTSRLLQAHAMSPRFSDEVSPSTFGAAHAD